MKTNIKRILRFYTNKTIKNYIISNDSIYYETDEVHQISTYKLASYLKELMLDLGRGYCIMSFIDFDGTWFANVSGSVFKQGLQGSSEPEVIFKAVEWILNQEQI